ncbi:hypothetical protein E4U47_000933 [Claviceps purpurea]|nr:hypothetical protein E4U12_007374 [Claviceps purpurea]KAG6252835.1 hypothetical protein E4U23_008384 [Claviceps purpurea]KAG6275359.1 hypothetical protein E4U47_000933 [Claviceps purpurea]KAG6308047.1 hypothetical protein E4U45_002560 [Claviceps purpurea]
MGKPKRNVLAAAEQTLTPPPALEPNQFLVRVAKPQGNNLYACELPDKTPLVLELAQRFRNTIWIKRGGFVLAERYADGLSEGRAEGEIVNVVRDEKLWRKQTYWPQEFTKNSYNISDDDEDDSNVGKMPPSDSEED